MIASQIDLHLIDQKYAHTRILDCQIGLSHYSLCLKQPRYKRGSCRRQRFNWVKIALQGLAHSAFNWDGVIGVLLKNHGGVSG